MGLVSVMPTIDAAQAAELEARLAASKNGTDGGLSTSDREQLVIDLLVPKASNNGHGTDTIERIAHILSQEVTLPTVNAVIPLVSEHPELMYPVLEAGLRLSTLTNPFDTAHVLSQVASLSTVNAVIPLVSEHPELMYPVLEAGLNQSTLANPFDITQIPTENPDFLIADLIVRGMAPETPFAMSTKHGSSIVFRPKLDLASKVTGYVCTTAPILIDLGGLRSCPKDETSTAQPIGRLENVLESAAIVELGDRLEVPFRHLDGSAKIYEPHTGWVKAPNGVRMYKATEPGEFITKATGTIEA